MDISKPAERDSPARAGKLQGFKVASPLNEYRACRNIVNRVYKFDGRGVDCFEICRVSVSHGIYHQDNPHTIRKYTAVARKIKPRVSRSIQTSNVVIDSGQHGKRASVKNLSARHSERVAAAIMRTMTVPAHSVLSGGGGL